MKRHTLTQAERLRGKNNIDALFAARRSISRYPVRIVFRERPAQAGETPCSIFVSVPKRLFKRAVRRTRIRRRIREIYRLNKTILTEPLFEQGRHLDLAFLVIGREEPSYEELERVLLPLFRKLGASRPPGQENTPSQPLV